MSTRRLRLAGEEPRFGHRRRGHFALFLPLADRIELTEVLEDVAGDTSMRRPARSAATGARLSARSIPAEDGRPPFRFVTLERRT